MITVIGHFALLSCVLVDVWHYLAYNAFSDFLNTLGIKKHETTGSHSKAKVCCERLVQTFQQSLVNLVPTVKIGTIR
jgi:hypothetical protein